jgi:hypothetical protein
VSTSPLEGPIADKITSGLRDTLYDVTFVQVSESYDPATGTTTTTRTDFTCRGFRDEFGKGVVSDGLAKQTDTKFVLLQQTLTDSNDNQIEPDGDDEIKHDGTTYSIINSDTDFGVQQDPAGATWEIQCRS